MKAIYEAAVYEISNSGIKICVNKLNLELDDLLEEYQENRWCFVTAWNPGGKERSLKENYIDQIKLLEDLSIYKVLDGMSRSEDGTHAEGSFLVLGMDKEEGIRMAERYGQLAFLHGKKGEQSILHFM